MATYTGLQFFSWTQCISGLEILLPINIVDKNDQTRKN